jgi:hypothetical protein
LFGPLGYVLLALAIGGAFAQSVAVLLAGLGAIAPLVVAAWLARRKTLANLKVAVGLLYGAVVAVMILCLVQRLPSSTFWVVSSVVPAWQAWRLMGRANLDRAFQTLRYATRLFLVVMIVALWLPVVLTYR